MASEQVHTAADEPSVRAAIAAALQRPDASVVTNAVGNLVVEMGSVGKAYLMGPFRAVEQMPVIVKVATAPSGSGTSVTIEVEARNTGGGFASGGLIGISKQKKAIELWLGRVRAAVQQGGPAPGQFTT